MCMQKLTQKDFTEAKILLKVFFYWGLLYFYSPCILPLPLGRAVNLPNTGSISSAQ